MKIGSLKEQRAQLADQEADWGGVGVGGGRVPNWLVRGLESVFGALATFE